MREAERGYRSKEAVTTERPADEKPAVKAESVPRKPERKKVERLRCGC